MRLVDLFCGCGGMSLGFQNAGFDVIAAYDKWEPAVNIYRANFTHPIFEYDLNNNDVIDEIDSNHPDIIIGGPPCQDFSIAGLRNLGERANLTIRYAEIVAKVRPKWFVMENVYNIIKMPILPKAIEIFKMSGYGLTYSVFDASYYGVPQMRKRFIMIGCLGEKDGFLDLILDKHKAIKPMSVFDYLGTSLRTEFYYMHPRSYNRRAVFSIYEPSATIRGVNRPVPSNYKSHPSDKTSDLSKVRALTSAERGLIQTFPADFKWVGNKSDIEQAIGNAVPVRLAEYIGKAILEYEEKR